MLCWVLLLCCGPLLASAAALEPSDAVGCCVHFTLDEANAPCCHNFSQNVLENDCPLGVGVDFHLNQTCLEARQHYEGLPSLSSSATPSPSPSSSRSLSPCEDRDFCSSHGVCKENECHCDKGFGRRDPSQPNTCAEETLDLCPDKCYGYGFCDVSSKECQCYEGFLLQNCSHWARCQHLNYCSGQGVCSRPPNPEACICNPGFSGPDCSETATDCLAHCTGHGVCRPLGTSNTLTCICDHGYGGPSCSHWIGLSCPKSCSGFGSCLPSGNCSCTASLGVIGPDCSRAIDRCGGCKHGVCRNGVCQCAPGYAGSKCDFYIPSTDKCRDLNYCSGKGVCSVKLTHNSTAQVRASTATAQASTSITSSVECVCFEGYGGSDCSALDSSVTVHCPGYCNGHGRCSASKSVRCECNDGWTGDGCEVSVCPIMGDLVCSGRGICEADSLTGVVGCVCEDGWTGDGCQTSLCLNGCSGHGRCLVNGTCLCQPSYGGADCSEDTSHYLKKEGDAFTGTPTTMKQKSASTSTEGSSPTTSDPASTTTPESQSSESPISSAATTGDSSAATSGTTQSEPDTSPVTTEESLANEKQDGGVEYASGEPGITEHTKALEDASGAGVVLGCPFDCSGRGECVDLVCHCFDGYSGGDCAIGPDDTMNIQQDLESQDQLGELLDL